MAKLPYEQHKAYKEESLTNRRFKHKDIVPLLEQLKTNPLFDVQVIGKSVEQRDIYMVKAGSGKTKVLLWSQMHGDESTATMALFDLFNFLQQSDDMDSVRQEILTNTTLYIIPMLNPDGAERFIRRNALHLDLNRDALRLQSPEAVLLKSIRDSLDPEFGFNLHDQSRYYTVGNTSKPATISFLAPAFDHAQTVNTVRARAMRTIVGMNAAIQELIPGQVAKYSDEHEPRAFGDNIQKWGTSVILIESGGYPGDPEKQVIRQLNFASMVAALHLIATDGYSRFTLKDYYNIPENERNLFDLVIRNATYEQDGLNTLLDVGIMRDEVASGAAPKGFYYSSSIEELGDMSTFYGYEELNAEGLTLVPGKVYPNPFKNVKDLSTERANELLKQGFTTIRVEQLPEKGFNPQSLPLNITIKKGKVNHSLALERKANFVLQDKSGHVHYAVVNGFVYDMQGARPAFLYGLIL
ncbi:M14 family metallopeptidase [Pontibacter sp. MBLB2868]|uniref:M14 family metallopeptidase n=1 Tax=Pontibacter sp. MBLB2868 TaxID=3451555 RepID=UPI003F7542C6